LFCSILSSALWTIVSFFSFGLYIIILPLRLHLWCLQTFLCYWKYASSFLGVQTIMHQALHFFFNLFPLSSPIPHNEHIAINIVHNKHIAREINHNEHVARKITHNEHHLLCNFWHWWSAK
jgi:hypothetical protein